MTPTKEVNNLDAPPGYEAVPGYGSCEGCIYEDAPLEVCRDVPCTPAARKDEQHVVFIQRKQCAEAAVLQGCGLPQGHRRTTLTGTERVPPRTGWAFGLLFNPHALWLGVHYSQHTKRICINLLPCLTVWVTRRGGTEPWYGQ